MREEWTRFLEVLWQRGRRRLADSFSPPCTQEQLTSIERAILRPPTRCLKEWLSITAGSSFDRAEAWDTYAVLPPQAMMDVPSALAELSSPDTNMRNGDFPLLGAIDRIFVVEDSSGAIVYCDPESDRLRVFDGIEHMLRTLAAAHEGDVFRVMPDESVDCDFASLTVLASQMNPKSAFWRS